MAINRVAQNFVGSLIFVYLACGEPSFLASWHSYNRSPTSTVSIKWVTPVRRYVLTPRSGCRSDRMVPQHLPTPTHCTSYTTTTTITTIANTAKPKQSRLLLPMAMAYGSPLISYRRNRSFPGEKSYKLKIHMHTPIPIEIE